MNEISDRFIFKKKEVDGVLEKMDYEEAERKLIVRPSETLDKLERVFKHHSDFALAGASVMFALDACVNEQRPIFHGKYQDRMPSGKDRSKIKKARKQKHRYKP